MRHSRLSADLNAKSPGSWRNERGAFQIAGLIVTAGVLITLAYHYQHFGTLGATDRQRVSQCIAELEAAQKGLERTATLLKVEECDGIADPVLKQQCEERVDKREIAYNDDNAQKIHACKAFLEQIPGATGRSVRELGRLLPRVFETFNLGQCSFQEDPPVGTAGAPYNWSIRAHIPFEGEGATGSLNMTGEVQASGENFKPAANAPPFTWSGSFRIPGAETRAAAGKASQINVFASGSVFELDPTGGARKSIPFKPDPGETCPGASTIDPASGICKVTCRLSKSFTWKAPPALGNPKLSISQDRIDAGSTTPVTLTAEVENAESASIDQGVGSVPAGEGPKSSPVAINPLPRRTTKYTLTAKGFGVTATGAQETKSADPVTLTVRPRITITSPANQADIPAGNVVVTGRVDPAPEGGGSVVISVEGAQFPASVGGDGQFTASVPLQKTLTRDDISIVDPGIPTVRTCGPKVQGVFVAAGKSVEDVTNAITVAAPDAIPDSRVVRHAVLLQRFISTWRTCPSPRDDQNVGIGILLRAGTPREPVRNVTCGVNGPFSRSCLVDVTVRTSVGELTQRRQWNFAVPSCE